MPRKKDDGQIKKFNCLYCGNKFEREIFSGGSGKHARWSSAAKCDKCGNFLKLETGD